jgi:hypothetical protein
LVQQSQRMRELHLVIEFDKPNHIPTTAAAVAIKQILARVHQETGLMIIVQGAQSHPAAQPESPFRMPILSLEVLQQRNLPLQFVEGLTIHGLLTSIGSIRQTAPRSQATMVGARKKLSPMAPAFAQQQTLSRRRYTQRRIVDGSGERDGSRQPGAAASRDLPAAICSQAACRQLKLNGDDGASQRGRIVNVFLQGRQMPRRTQRLVCRSSWHCRHRPPWPMIVSPRQSGHQRGRRSNRITPARRCLLTLRVR